MARITQNGEKNAFIFIVVPLLRIADGSEFVKGFLLRLRPATLLKKRLWHKCFSVNFVKFLRTPFLTEHIWWFIFIVIPLLRIADDAGFLKKMIVK